MSLDTEAQNDELLAISCIYDDCFFQTPTDTKECGASALGGELRLHIKLPKPFTISRKRILSTVTEKLNVSYLPPLVLNFYFPPTYPSLNKPNFTLSCKWLSKYQLADLCKQLDKLWEAENVVMFTWAQFLTDEALSFLKIDNILELPNGSNRLRTKSNCQHDSSGENARELVNEHNRKHSPSETNTEAHSETQTDCKCRTFREQTGGLRHETEACFNSKLDVSNSYISETVDERGVQDFSPELNLFSYLREYNEDEKLKKFNSTKYECMICFSEKSGSNCMEFYPCCHVFCKSCCKSFFQVQIEAGNIKLLKCPTDKCSSDASPKQVESLVSREMYEKWDKMLLNSALSSLEDIQLCPRMHCQYPVTIDELIGSCPACSFVFCALCRFGYHGLEKCRFKQDEVKDIVNKYQKGTAEERQKLISKFGKRRVVCLVEEYLSASYISDEFKKCPKCKANIEKIDGCNKMSCNRCNTHFCWLCSEIISSANPYSHFTQSGTSCYDQLFQGVMPDDWIDHNEDHQVYDADDEFGDFDNQYLIY